MINSSIRLFLASVFFIFAAGCSMPHKVLYLEDIEGLPKQFAVYDGVFWSKYNTRNFRHFISTSPELFKDKTVYDIGTGTGIYALLAIHAGSKFAIATDIDADSVQNAKFNASNLDVADKMDVRLVSEKTPEAYSVLKENERFDIIISGPPWGSSKPLTIKDRLTRDEDYMLLKSIVTGLNTHLNPGGVAILFIGNMNAIKIIRTLAAEQHLKMEILDEKTNESYINASAVPPVNSRSDGYFFPGVIIKLTPHA